VHNIPPQDCLPFINSLCAFRNFTARYDMHLHERDDESHDVSTLFRLQSDAMANVFRHYEMPLRFFITLTVEMTRLSGDDEFEFSVHYFHSLVHTVWAEGSIRDALQTACAEISACLEQYQERGSGLVVVAIQTCTITVGRFIPPTVGCARFVLPAELPSRKCLVNVNEQLNESEKNMCFVFSVLASLHPARSNRSRASCYRDHFGKYWFPSTYPVTFPQDVQAFERKNSVSVNVYGYDREQRFVYPLKVNDSELEKHVDLLLIDDHFVLITNFGGLFANRRTHRFRCKRCMMGFRFRTALGSHLSLCKEKKAVRTVCPAKGDALYFRSPHTMEPFPYFCVYDFEAILEAENMGQAYEKRVLSSFCILVIRSKDSRIVEQFLYRGEDCVEKFISILNQLSKLIGEWIRSEEVPMVSVDEEAHASASHCAICGESFGNRKRKVRDHDHFSGSYRQSLCQGCNLNLRVNKKVIPVLAHNHSYDLAFILPKLDLFESKDIKVLATSCQQFKRLDVGNLRFLDSLAFLPASLDALVQDLRSKGLENLCCLKQAFPQHVELLALKGVFPYDYVTSFEAYREPELPPRESFYNKLNDSRISEDDYRHAQTVFETFNFKSLGEYSDCYLKLDCLLLADVFQNFRKWTLDTYELDPLHYVSLPALSLACALKQTGVKLELLDDVDVYLFIEAGLRGGIVQCAIRNTRANVPGTACFDPNTAVSQILDLDVNGLYASTMRQALPCADFRWLDREEIDALHFQQVTDDAPEGYILEVDLDYPRELHDSHADFPLAPEKRGVPLEWLSPYQKALVEKFHLPQRESERKLLLTFYPKRNYIIHYRNLKLYLELGLQLKAIHRVLKFSQSAFLKDFVDFNHNLRKEATNAFQKNLSKLIMNSIYGKTIENPRQYNNVVISVSEDEVLKNLQKPNLRQFAAISPTVVIFQFSQRTLHLNKPVYAGFSILEMSKLVMYEFFYKQLASREHYVRAKGVKRCESRKLTYELYVQTLEQQTLHKITQRTIARKLCKNKTVAVEKIGLNPFDKKRFIDTDGVSTLPFGHWSL
ncbi:uncharacterized protein ISCGN_005937, partial [Ixodes scapularis]